MPTMPSTFRPRHAAASTEEAKRQSDRRRGSAAKRGYDADWRRERAKFIKSNPLCIDCLAEGRAEPTKVVDHDPPHRGDMAKFWDRSTWRARCKPHHDAKTAREDGGFGNPRRLRP